MNLDPTAGDNWGIIIGDWDWLNDVDYDLHDSQSFNNKYEIQKGDVKKYRLEGMVTELDIEAGGCSFRVKESEDEYFYVEAQNIGKLQAYVESGTLYIITTTNEKKWSELSDSKVTLYAPAGYRYDEVEAELGAGVMDFPRLCAAKASLEVGAGQIVLSEIEVEELSISVGAGQVRLTDMDVSELEAEVSVGELVAKGAVRRSVDAECSMGNIELRLAGKQKDFNYELSGAMGNVTLGSESYIGFATERTIDNGAEKRIEVECSMGNITIKFED